MKTDLTEVLQEEQAWYAKLQKEHNEFMLDFTNHHRQLLNLQVCDRVQLNEIKMYPHELYCIEHVVEEVEFWLQCQLESEQGACDECIKKMWGHMEEMRKQDVCLADEVQELRVKFDMGETQIKALLTKHHKWMAQKIEETLYRGWKEWSAQQLY